VLRISVKTVEKHRSNLMRKLGLHNTAAVTVYACARASSVQSSPAPALGPGPTGRSPRPRFEGSGWAPI